MDRKIESIQQTFTRKHASTAGGHHSEVQRRWLNQIPKGHSVANKERSLPLRGAIRQLGVAPRGGDEKHHHSDRLQDQGPMCQENGVETTLILG